MPLLLNYDLKIPLFGTDKDQIMWILSKLTFGCTCTSLSNSLLKFISPNFQSSEHVHEPEVPDRGLHIPKTVVITCI